MSGACSGACSGTCSGTCGRHRPFQKIFRKLSCFTFFNTMSEQKSAIEGFCNSGCKNGGCAYSSRGGCFGDWTHIDSN